MVEQVAEAMALSETLELNYFMCTEFKLQSFLPVASTSLDHTKDDILL